MENTRKNAKDAALKEEERICKTLKNLQREGQIDKELFNELKPVGSQPPRLYGLAKVRKDDVPLRPVLSMPGSPYHKIGQKIADWLSVLPESKINSSTKQVADQMNSTILQDDEVIVSFDVSSLYTNVPVNEAIHKAADLLFESNATPPRVTKETFITLAKLSSLDVIMSTHAGYYRQVNGLAMGSPPAPHFANVWLSSYDPIIKDEAPLYERYMDDVLRYIKALDVGHKLTEINGLHPNLKFTIEHEQEGILAFLDLCITHSDNSLQSSWYTKSTDTGLTMNFHAVAPRKYKRSVVQCFAHRIFRACSGWKQTLERNQYPPEFYDPIFATTIEKLVSQNPAAANEGATPQQQPNPITPSPDGNKNQSTECETQQIKTVNLSLQYRGRATDNLLRKMKQMNSQIKPLLTLRKLKTALPSLKTSSSKEDP